MFITVQTWQEAYRQELHPTGKRAAAYAQEGDQYPLATVALVDATDLEASACAEALAHGVSWERWPVHYTQLSHWAGGPRP